MSTKTSMTCEIRNSIPLAPAPSRLFRNANYAMIFHAAILKLFRERARFGHDEGRSRAQARTNGPSRSRAGCRRRATGPSTLRLRLRSPWTAASRSGPCRWKARLRATATTRSRAIFRVRGVVPPLGERWIRRRRVHIQATTISSISNASTQRRRCGPEHG